MKGVAAVAGSSIDGGELGFKGRLGPFVFFWKPVEQRYWRVVAWSFPAVMMNKPGIVHKSELIL